MVIDFQIFWWYMKLSLIFPILSCYVILLYFSNIVLVCHNIISFYLSDIVLVCDVTGILFRLSDIVLVCHIIPFIFQILCWYVW